MMFGIGKKPSDRRRKVQRERAESTKPPWERFQERIGLWPTAVMLVFFLIRRRHCPVRQAIARPPDRTNHRSTHQFACRVLADR